MNVDLLSLVVLCKISWLSKSDHASTTWLSHKSKLRNFANEGARKNEKKKERQRKTERLK